jgi:tRNA (guanine9-N1)-methyltransferase
VTSSSSSSSSSRQFRDWATVRREQRLRQREREVALIAIQDPGIIIKRKERAAKRTLQMRDIARVHLRGRIVLDAQWDALMKRKDIISVTTQMSALYSVNRLLGEPFHIDVVGLAAADQLRTRIDSKLPHIRSWFAFHCHDAALLDHFAALRHRLVYLTAESDVVLTDVADDDIYIVGALVDHNTRVGLCHQFATDNNLRTARLPLAENIALNSRKVLAINHVVQILCRHRHHAGDWAAAVADTMPTRKIAGVGTTKRQRRSRPAAATPLDQVQSTAQSESSTAVTTSAPTLS